MACRATAADSLRAIAAARLFAYHVKARLAAWRSFCRELNADPDMADLPGQMVVREAEPLAEQDAYSEAGAVEWMRNHEPGASAPTVEALTAELRTVFAEQVAYWRGV
jgi:hypothetical protein